MEILEAGGAGVPSSSASERVDSFLHYLVEIKSKLAMRPPAVFEQSGLTLPRFGPHPIAEPPTLHRIAGMLYGDPKPTMGELKSTLSVPASTLSRIVSTMEEQGLAQRLPDDEDGRVVRVSLTPAGRRLYEVMHMYGVRSAQSILDCLTAEEQIILLTLMGKVVSNLKKEP